MGDNKAGFVKMTLGFVGVVLVLSLFSTVLGTSGSSGLVYLLEHTNISTFTALSTIIQISAVVLLLYLVFESGRAYYAGYKTVSTSDASGIMRMVLGVVQLIVFIALFYTVMTSTYTLYSHGNASAFTAFTTVTAIVPTVLFLGGIFGSVAIARSGIKTAWKRRRRLT